MSDTSPVLGLPLIQPAQAQKHVTHNEALSLLEAVTQLSIEHAPQSAPPVSPQRGQRFIVGAGGSGAWAGRDRQIAVFDDAGWIFVVPQAGWRAGLADSGETLRYDGAEWVALLPELQNLQGLGIAATSDAVNRLAVASEATLFNHAGAGHQIKVNKAAVDDTASLLFQTGFSGRVEMGTAGGDDWAVKVSADGQNWTEALRIDAQTGRVLGAAVQSSGQDATSGRLMAVPAFGIGEAGDQAPLDDIDRPDVAAGSLWRTTDATLGTMPPAQTAFGNLMVLRHASDALSQIWTSVLEGDLWIRRYRAASEPQWSAWLRYLNTANMVGPVAMSAGAPAGAAIERGSTAGGEFVCLADGTQICWQAIATLDTGPVNWVFPRAFAAPPVVAGMGRTSGPRVVTASDVTATEAGINGYILTGARAPFWAMLQAVGRWV
ncbi:Protein of unknown function [Roseovarius azorensis]|uniref:DUF2793 domain-containing protein n=1 Tax=Roseovarius azorensis TaxID=1287727 RepID=A0A1H7NS46_9RHOB|nr:DUF2793 domain-containing protein [Roseovarius azorensis]SEL26191.1 Protein of unknown function [Roseovarius azorensis]